MAELDRRWDGDARGAGIADGRAFRPGVDALAAGMAEAGWVAEEPDAHLLPHVQRACAESRRFRVVEARDDGAVYEVTVDWTPEEATKSGLRADVFALVGSFAELSTHVRQRPADDAIVFDVTTGMLAEETPFRPHGHLVRFVVVGDAVRRLAG